MDYNLGYSTVLAFNQSRASTNIGWINGDIYVLRKWTKNVNGELDFKLNGKYLTAGERHRNCILFTLFSRPVSLSLCLKCKR